MPRKIHSPVPQPVFDEPVFNKGLESPNPTRFETKHSSDAPQYKQIQDLLKKDVVGFEKSRLKPGDLYELESALGPHGDEIVKSIEDAGQIVFHGVGDSSLAQSRVDMVTVDLASHSMVSN